MKLKTEDKCRYRITKQSEWIAEAKLYLELPNPSWIISKTLVKKIESRFKRLRKQVDAGIPDLSVDDTGYKGITLKEPNGNKWNISQGTVFRFGSKLIEFAEDADRTIESMILDSMPDHAYEEVRHFL